MVTSPLRGWARRLKREALTVYFVARHPATPWWIRLLALIVAAYALSPIDLIPDFIPVLGYLDDLLLVPLGCGWLCAWHRLPYLKHLAPVPRRHRSGRPA